MKPRLRAAFAPFGLGVALAGGCTFGGIADYDVENCDPSASTQSADVCDRLNTDPTTCTPFQCDAATSRCVQRDRDDDRDGDAAAACGGGDCDDQDADRSSKTAEVCDEADNNCDDVIDEDVITTGDRRTIAATGELSGQADPTFAPTEDGYLATLVATTKQGSCLQLVPLNQDSTGPLSTGCSLLDSTVTLAPRQAFTAPVKAGFGAAFVTTSGCVGGALSYVFQAASARQVDVACSAAAPVALPSVGLFPSAGSKAPGVIAWYQTSVNSRADAISDCEAAKPVPLSLAYQADLSDPSAITARELSAETTSMRPAALLPLASDAAILLASPVESDAGVWLLAAESVSRGDALPAPQRFDELAGARSVALASTELEGETHVAIAAEIGCFGDQSLTVLLTTLSSGKLEVSATIELAKGSALVAEPSVVWVPQRGGEWWVSWIDDRPGARLQRYSAEGIAIGEVIDLGEDLLRGKSSAVSDGAALYGFDAAASGGAFVEIPVGCN
jgi:hypothetical protein